jgi:hypothetical protein
VLTLWIARRAVRANRTARPAAPVKNDLTLALEVHAHKARRCATSGQRNGSLPRSPTLLR